jgi:glycosyltransferase involved in cell wall biosynthesis
MLVYDAHELETQTNYVLEPETKRAIEDYERILAPRTDNVVTVCESIADWLVRRYGIEQPVVIVNSPAGGPLKSRPPVGVRNVLDLDESVPLAVYVGSVTIDRGLELCVDALAALPDVHLATVGPRYVETETAMIKRAAQLDVAHRLHLVDARPADEIVSFIGSANCSVMPIQNVCLSYYYCFPNKLLESVFAGLPVVVADLLELRNFVERYRVGVVVDERDPQSIAAGIRRTIEDDSLRPTEQIRREVESVYGWPHQRELLYEMYSSMRARKPRTAAACAG